MNIYRQLMLLSPYSFVLRDHPIMIKTMKVENLSSGYLLINVCTLIEEK